MALTNNKWDKLARLDVSDDVPLIFVLGLNATEWPLNLKIIYKGYYFEISFEVS